MVELKDKDKMKKITAIMIILLAAFGTGCSTMKVQPTAYPLGASVSLPIGITDTAKTTAAPSVVELENEIESLRRTLRDPAVSGDPELVATAVREITRKKKVLDMALAEQAGEKKPFSQVLKDSLWDFSSGWEGTKSTLALAGVVAGATYVMGIWDFDMLSGKSDSEKELIKVQADALKENIRADQQRVSIDGKGNTVELKDLPQSRTVKLEVSGSDNDVVIDLQQNPF